jgi:hypothetical protein
MNKILLLVILVFTVWSPASLSAQAPLSFPEGIWVGEYTCRGQAMPLMIEFDKSDKPASISFLLKRKKRGEQSAKFHANVEQMVNKQGQEVVVFKPRYWLNNPGNFIMLKLRGKYLGETIEGTVKKKGCKTFSVQQLPCKTVPNACSEEALGPLYALLGNVKTAKKSKEAKLATIAKTSKTSRSATNELPKLGDRQFNSLLKQLKAKPFQKGQLVILSRWSNQYNMSSQQVATLLKLQRFPSDQIEVLKLLAGSISDTENITLVLDVMRFREERKAAEKIIFESGRDKGLQAPIR